MAVTSRGIRMVVTLVVVAAAVLVGWRLWAFYTLAPWTRDARVLANVVEIAPDVSGLIDAINVTDNQEIRKGDVLFVIDRQRFQVAVQQAQAAVAQRRQALTLAQDDADRDSRLRASDTSAISVENVEKSTTRAAEAGADLAAAEATLASAEIDLTRAEVRSPVDGYVTNLTATVGDYARVGNGVLAVVDRHSFYVYAYFMETKLPFIRVGDAATVTLMAGDVQIEGKVEGISRAIGDANATAGLLARVDPEFEWIRLAQRIPVRIRLGEVPEGVPLISGLSATVAVHPGGTGPQVAE